MAGWKDPAHRLDAERLNDLWRQIDWQVGSNSPPGAERISIVICGGAAMCYLNPDRGTGDIDLLHEIPAVLREAANTVGKRRGLEAGWFNDGPSHFADYSSVLPIASVPIFEGIHLSVTAPRWEYLLGMKVIAAREEDEDDIRWLMGRLNISQAKELYRAAERVSTSIGQKRTPTREQKRVIRRTVRGARQEAKAARRRVRRQARDVKRQKRAEVQRGAEQE